MNHPAELLRFSELIAAFVEIASDRTDIQLRGSASPESLIYAVRLQPEPASPGAELVLWRGGGKLTNWSADGRATRASGTERELHIDLRAGFLWECLEFPDAHELATALLQRAQNELEANAY